jgi:hypothetical protein
MRVTRLILSISLFFLVSFCLSAQQTATSNPQASQLLQRSLSALAGNQTLTDVTLTGTARRIAGSDDESGTATLKALASGASRIDLSLPSGQRSEILNASLTPPAGSWSGPDGVSHAIAFHNLLTGPAWFFPAFAIAPGLSAPGCIATYIGHETRNGQGVEHVSVSQTSPFGASSKGLSFQHLSQVDFFLDSTTLLPAAIVFNVHPDDNALLDIPVEVRLSDYRSINGAQIPFHIQKFLNNSLILNFQAQTVTANSGLSPSAFVVTGS